MTRGRVEAIITTSHPIPAYGGVQLSKEALEQLAAALRAGELPMMHNHDWKQPIDATIVDARVRERDDGHYEVWAEVDVDREQWEASQQRIKDAGAPGGMSFAFSETLDHFPRDASGQPSIAFAADAHHFTDEEIEGAAQELIPLGSVEAERYFQFAAVPLPVVLLVFAKNFLENVPAGVLADYIFASLRRLCRKSDNTPTIMRTVVEEESDEEGRHRRKAVFEIQTDDPDVLRNGIDAMVAMFDSTGTHVYDQESGKWLDHGDAGIV